MANQRLLPTYGALALFLLLPVPLLAQSTGLSALEGGDKDAEQVSESAPSAETLRGRIKVWDSRTDRFRQVLEQAPARLAALDERLANAASAPPPEVDLRLGGTELDHTLDLAEQELALALRKKDELGAELDSLAERRRRLPTLLANAKAALRSAAQDTLSAPLEGSEQAQGASEAQLQLNALEAEVAAHEAELRSHDLHRAILDRERQLASHQVAQSQALVQALRERLRTAQQAQILTDAKSVLELLEAEDLPKDLRAAVQTVATENAEMTRAWAGEDGLDVRIATVLERLTHARKQVQEVDAERERIAEKVDAASMADSVGALLRKERTQAPDIGMYRRFVRMRQDQIAEAQLQHIRLRERRDALSDVEARVEEALAAASSKALSEEQRKRIGELLRELYGGQLKYLDLLISDHDAYFQALVGFDVEQRRLIDSSEALIEFIDTHVLWVPSGAVVSLATFEQAPGKLLELASERLLQQGQRAVTASIARRPGSYVLLGALLLGYLALAARSRRLHAHLADRTTNDYEKSFAPTLLAVLLTLVLASLPPVLCLAFAYLAGNSTEATNYVRACAIGLSAAAVMWATLRLARQSFRKNGVLHGHMGQPLGRCQRLSRSTLLLSSVAVPAVFFIYTLEARGDDIARESAGRLLFVFLMVAASLFALVLLRQPTAGPRQSDFPASAATYSGRGRKRLRLAAFLAPAGLIVAALAGFYWTALQLAVRSHFTMLLAGVLFFISRLLLRWAEVARQRVAVARNQAALEAVLLDAATTKDGAASSSPDTHGSLDRPSIHVDQLLDLDSVSAQTRRLTSLVLVTIGLLGVFSIWADLMPAAGVLRKVELWETTREVTVVVPDDGGTEHLSTEQQQVPITLAELAMSLAIAGFSWLLLRNLPGLIEVSLFQRLQGGERYAYATIIKYAIGLIGGALALDTVGIGWSSIQWLVAAVGLGLGFGLQEIFANFVSGLIILFERPIRVGDTVTVGDVSGTVSRIRIRATWITSFDRKELVVPNKEFVSNRLVNWTLSDQVLRVELKIGLAYGSDTRRALALLEQLARKSRIALTEPAPRALFQGFGDSALLFELRVYVSNPDHVLQIRHELNLAIDDAFRKAGLEIAFPQMDIHVRDLPASKASEATEA